MEKLKFQQLILLALFLMAPIVATSQAASMPSEVYFKKNAVLTVFNEIKQSVEDIHPNPYHSISKEKVNVLFSQISRNLPDSILEEDFYRLLMPVVNSYNDGHIQLTVPLGKFANKKIGEGKGIFPFTLCQVNDSVFVRLSVFDEVVKPGYQLISIDNIPIDSVINNYSNFKFGDNLEIRKRKALDDFTAVDLFVNSGKDSYTVGYKKYAADSIRFCNVKSAKKDDIIKFNQSYIPQNIVYFSKPIFKLQNLIYLQQHSNRSIALLTLPSFAVSQVSEELASQYKQKIDSVFQHLKDSKIDTLLIDIRRNDGGDDFASECILKHIASKNYKGGRQAFMKRSRQQQMLYEQMLKQELSDSMFVKSSSYRNFFKTKEGDIIELKGGKAKKAPSNTLYKGKVFVLIGNQTFSAAVTFAAITQCNRFATLVGEETDGRTSCYTSRVPVNLSIPTIQFGVAHRLVVNACSKGFNRGLKPDIEVRKSLNSYLKGKDDVVEYFLNRQ